MVIVHEDFDAASPAFFVGTVGHRRLVEADHSFVQRVFYSYVDVDTAGATLAPLPGWSATRRAPMRFRAADHLDRSGRPLADAVRDLVAERCGVRPCGPVLLLTQVRMFGFAFNPLSVFFCWNEARTALDAIVLEVTNTPWNDRHWYVLDRDTARAGEEWRVPKAMHVSPFLDMDVTHIVRLDGPDSRLRLRIEDRRADDSVVFAADLDLHRVPLTAWNAVALPVCHPLQTWRVFAAIHTHALRLWHKGVRIRTRPPSSEASVPAFASAAIHAVDVPAAGARGSSNVSDHPSLNPLASRRTSHGSPGLRPRRSYHRARRLALAARRRSHDPGTGDHPPVR